MNNPKSEPADITQLLELARLGDRESSSQIFSLLYEELRRIASAKMRNEANCKTIQATVLVNEAWIKLIGKHDDVRFETRGHFFVAASNAMRQILVDAARARQTNKRGGNIAHEPLEAYHAIQTPPDGELLDLHEALSDFEKRFPIKGDLVKLRYFSGMTIAQAAENLGISTATAERHWAFARAWLKKRMTDK